MSVNMEADTDKCVHANIENLETEEYCCVNTEREKCLKKWREICNNRFEKGAWS